MTFFIVHVHVALLNKISDYQSSEGLDCI